MEDAEAKAEALQRHVKELQSQHDKEKAVLEDRVKTKHAELLKATSDMALADGKVERLEQWIERLNAEKRAEIGARAKKIMKEKKSSFIHYCSSYLLFFFLAELDKLTQSEELPILLYHIKPTFEQRVLRELASLRGRNLQILQLHEEILF